MDPADNPFSKEACLARSPGNRKKKSAKEKGNDFEKEVQSGLKGSKRNNQAKPWGGCSNADIDFGDFAFETKKTKRLELPEWIRTKLSETPSNKNPGLIFFCEGHKWVMVKYDDRMPFAHHLVQSEGGEVSYP